MLTTYGWSLSMLNMLLPLSCTELFQNNNPNNYCSTTPISRRLMSLTVLGSIMLKRVAMLSWMLLLPCLLPSYTLLYCCCIYCTIRTLLPNLLYHLYYPAAESVGNCTLWHQYAVYRPLRAFVWNMLTCHSLHVHGMVKVEAPNHHHVIGRSVMPMC